VNPFGLTDRWESQEFPAIFAPGSRRELPDGRRAQLLGSVAVFRSAWEIVLWVLVVVFPWLLVRAGRRRDLAFLAVMWGILCASAQVLANPAGERHEAVIALGVLLALDLAAWLMPERVEIGLLKAARSKAAKMLLVCAGLGLVPAAIVERGCRLLTDLHVLNYHQAIQTVWRAGHDDWRLATITGDENREPDPVLLWRPVNHRPFNAQRFKGPMAEIPKPADVFRVMCYGDSLTDGPPRGGWPFWLHRLLQDQGSSQGRRCEVLNAGVAGYSSHQGVLRFLQEVDRFQPDLVLVSFGWNDAAEAIGQPDKTFKIPPWPVVACQRALVRYRTYLVLMYYTQKWRAEPPVAAPGPVSPRVSVDDYLVNMERFHTEAARRGITITYLTRPHRLSPGELSRNATWRGSVPRYNEALREWGRANKVAVLDVQRYFEQLPQDLFSDECHFTPQGYERMAKLVSEELATAKSGLPHVLEQQATKARSDVRKR
jgi:lysophospholipase L1-like esterase